MKSFCERFTRNEDGATAIEYGLIVALLSLIVISAMSSLLPEVTAVFDKIKNAFPAS